MKLLLPLLAALTAFAHGADLHVDPARGDDARDGVAQPVRTIARAIKLAQPGDTIHLRPAIYRESAGFYGKRGEPGRPITLDGHGAILEGSDPLDPAAWTEISPGLFRGDKVLPRIDDAILGRWFFLFDGRMNRMGRTSKGPSAPLKKPDELQPGEWTFVKDDAPTDPKTRSYGGAFFIRLAPGQALADAKIRAPVRSAGVQLSGPNAHLVIRNLIATHVYNDGFNIHGDARDLIFENIAAIECGDDGFSAHETAECRIDGFVSIGNSTGLCDTVSSVTHFKNIFIKDCLGYDVFFIGDSPHSMENGLIESRAARAVEISQHGDRPQAGLSSVVFKNVLIRRLDGPQEIRVGKNSRLQAERCTFLGLNVTVTPGGTMSARQCVFSGEPKPEILLFANALERRWQCLRSQQPARGQDRIHAADVRRFSETDRQRPDLTLGRRIRDERCRSRPRFVAKTGGHGRGSRAALAADSLTAANGLRDPGRRD